jgi:hypothetical protein
MSFMSRAQIEQAIAALSSEERRDLIRSLVPRKLVVTPQEAEQIRQAALAVPDGTWIDWEALKNEPPAKPV